MKLVIDTNVAVSGLLWSGPPNVLLQWARRGIVTIIVSEKVIDEFKTVIRHERFADRLETLQTSAQKVIAYFMNLSHVVPDPHTIPAVITEDPSDNIFLGLAIENTARLIVSGDRHLLNIGEFQGIHIVRPSEACLIIEKLIQSDKDRQLKSP